MHQHLVAQQFAQGFELLHMLTGLEAALDIGQALVHLHRVQRGVVPGVFDDGAVAGFDFASRFTVRHRATKF